MTDIEKRVAKLERENRFMKIGSLFLIAIIGIGFLTAQVVAPKMKIIEAQGFIVKDLEGNTRIEIGYSIDSLTNLTYNSSYMRILRNSKWAFKMECYSLGKEIGDNYLMINNPSSGDVQSILLSGNGILLEENDYRATLLPRSLDLSKKNKESYVSRAVLGEVNLVQTKTGGTNTTPLSSLTLFDVEEKVLWEAP